MIELLFGWALLAAVPVGFGIAADLIGRPHGRRGPSAMLIGLLMTAPAVVALALPRGAVAAALVIPWFLLGALTGLRAVHWLLPHVLTAGRATEPWRIGTVAALGYLVVGATWAGIDRAGIEPFGFGRTIVLLTAVHFHVAGFVLTLAGALAARARPGLVTSAALAALVVGMPLTALGFFGLPLVSWSGAALVAGGGIGIGAATISIGRRASDRVERVGLLVGGATLFVTMPLALAYATGTTLGLGFLGIPAMAAIHGGLNVVGFAVPTMVGWTRAAR